MSRLRVLAVLAAAVATSGVAGADPAATTAPAPAATAAPAPRAPEPTVLAAADANLESTARRQGITLQIALGGAFTLGFGVEDAVGNGPGASFRLGRVATPNTVITAELVSVALFHQVKSDPPGETETYTNQDNHLLIGAQRYVNPSLWVRAAVGIGGYNGEHVQIGGGMIGDIRLLGPAFAVGAGVEVLRLRRVAFGFEVVSIAMVNRLGVLSSNALMLDLLID